MNYDRISELTILAAKKCDHQFGADGLCCVCFCPIDDAHVDAALARIAEVDDIAARKSLTP